MTSHADSITEYPGKDDWLGWLDLLCREDTGTIDCVPACMREEIASYIGPDGRLNDPTLVPPTPFGIAKFCLMGVDLPWRGMGLTPDFIRELLAEGHDLAEIRALGEERKGMAMAGFVSDVKRRRELTTRTDLAATRPKHPDLYFIRSESGPIKIGISVDPQKRLKTLQTAHPFRLELLCVFAGAGKKEANYHSRFAAHRLHGEWFEPHPDILAEITRLNAEGADRG